MQDSTSPHQIGMALVPTQPILFWSLGLFGRLILWADRLGWIPSLGHLHDAENMLIAESLSLGIFVSGMSQNHANVVQPS